MQLVCNNLANLYQVESVSLVFIWIFLSKQMVLVVALFSLTNDSHHMIPRPSELRIQI